jgi:hypothetical protein
MISTIEFSRILLSTLVDKHDRCELAEAFGGLVESFPQEMRDAFELLCVDADYERLLSFAKFTASSFYLTSEAPEEHLALVATLLRVGEISVELAANLARVHPSNFSRMSRHAIAVVDAAERVVEEESLGFASIDSDNFFSSALLEFAYLKRQIGNCTI